MSTTTINNTPEFRAAFDLSHDYLVAHTGELEAMTTFPQLAQFVDDMAESVRIAPPAIGYTWRPKVLYAVKMRMVEMMHEMVVDGIHPHLAYPKGSRISMS